MKTRLLIASALAFVMAAGQAGATGGVYVATGDVNGDGRADCPQSGAELGDKVKDTPRRARKGGGGGGAGKVQMRDFSFTAKTTRCASAQADKSKPKPTTKPASPSLPIGGGGGAGKPH